MNNFEHDVALRVSGQDYKKWTAVSVTKSIDSLCGEFTFSSSQDSEFDRLAYPMKIEDECVIVAGGKTILTGYIDDMVPAYDSSGHAIEVAGRAKTEDLVDCCRAGSGNSWSNLTVRDLVAKLCSPHGISIVVDSTANSKANQREQFFTYNEGEKVIETLKRLLITRGIQPLTDAQGRLRLAKLGAVAATDILEAGVNVKAGRFTGSNKERFSDYFSKGIGFALPTKQTKDYIQPKGDAKDSGVSRYRPFVLINDTATSFGGNNDRAKWEAQLRAGNSRLYEYQVQGWLQSNGEPWDINMTVKVRDKALGVDEELLIYALSHALVPNEGTQTVLSLCSKEKYKAEAELSKVTSAFDFLGGLGG